jgi:hypothetical protein
MLNIKYIIISILIILEIKSVAFNVKYDSLQNIIKTKFGKEKVDYLNEISLDYCYNEPSIAKLLLFESIKCAENEKHTEGCGKAYIRLGTMMCLENTIVLYTEALTKYKSPKGLLFI